MLGITEPNTKYRKRDKNVSDVRTVNNHLGGARLAALGAQDEVHTIAENVEIHIPKEYHHRIHALIRKMSIYGPDN